MAQTCLEEMPNIEYASKEEAGERQVICYQKFVSLYYLYQKDQIKDLLKEARRKE